MRRFVERTVEAIVPIYICDRCGAEVRDAPIKIYVEISDPEHNDCMEYHFCCKECFISFIRSPEVERLIEYASCYRGGFTSKRFVIEIIDPERVLLEKLLRESKK